MKQLLSALSSATDGQCVAWVAQSRQAMKDAFDTASDATVAPAAFRHTNGNFEINFPNGGRLKFVLNPHIRGCTFDSVYVPQGSSEDQLIAIIPALQPTNGEIFHY